jgi:hypothetical protein
MYCGIRPSYNISGEKPKFAEDTKKPRYDQCVNKTVAKLDVVYIPSYNILARNKIPQVKNTQKPRYDQCDKRLVLRKAVASKTNIGGKPKFVLTTNL